MPFTDNLSNMAKNVGKGASNAAQNLAKMSGKMVEVSKLSMEVASNEDKIESIYKEIGKYVYRRFENGEELYPELMQKCSNLRKIEVDNDKLKENISKLKNVKLCPNCGSEMKKDATYCSSCGAKL